MALVFLRITDSISARITRQTPTKQKAGKVRGRSVFTMFTEGETPTVFSSDNKKTTQRKPKRFAYPSSGLLFLLSPIISHSNEKVNSNTSFFVGELSRRH